jgi:predicted AAA+ superfamily ATPase
MSQRTFDLESVESLLGQFPVVAILGPRQIGKTTLASMVAKRFTTASSGRTKAGVTHFDLERPSDLARLADPELALSPLKGLVILDEIQRRPDLFPLLRVLADRRPRRARFLILGSAAPELLRQGSETLAGRLALHELDGFGLDDVGLRHWRRLWLRGGFPRSYLAKSDGESGLWREQLVRTYLERDIPSLGIRLAPATLERFWSMLAHYHGQTWNSAELARAFGVSDKTIRHWIEILESTFMVRTLRPWSENLGKRVVRTPKLYLTDSGLLHSLLRIGTMDELSRHPKIGASFEGFAIAQVIRRLGVPWRDCFFWATHQNAELDLLVARGRRRIGFEIKHTVSPQRTRSMAIAIDDLHLDRLDVIHLGSETFEMAPRIRAVAFSRLFEDLES